MKPVNEQFPNNPLPTRSVGDGKFVIVSCIIACSIISVLAVVAILSIHF
jgi:hypothetical protein